MERPQTYDDLHEYIPHMGTMEYWKGVGPGEIEFRFKTATTDGQHQADFACVVKIIPTGDCKQKILKCVQQAHDWRFAHEVEAMLPK